MRARKAKVKYEASARLQRQVKNYMIVQFGRPGVTPCMRESLGPCPFIMYGLHAGFEQ